MAYATIAEFRQAFGDEAIDLSNLDSPGSGEVNAPVLNRALDDATAEINAYLQAAGYTLPLEVATIPPILRNCCVDIARYRLDRYQVRDFVRQRYEDAIKFLQALATGKASLGITNPVDAAIATEPSLVEYYTGSRVFSQSLLKDY